jgi:hypothetical protein
VERVVLNALAKDAALSPDIYAFADSFTIAFGEVDPHLAQVRTWRNCSRHGSLYRHKGLAELAPPYGYPDIVTRCSYHSLITDHPPPSRSRGTTAGKLGLRALTAALDEDEELGVASVSL